MIPFVDIHCHLLPGLDDGPKSLDESLEMCRIALADGIQTIIATPHINEQWPDVTASRIDTATRGLRAALVENGLSLNLHSAAEVMVSDDLLQRWQDHELPGLGTGNRYLLIELSGVVFDGLEFLARELIDAGTRPILAHPERYTALLQTPERIDRLIRSGFLMQLNARTLTETRSPALEKVVRGWLRHGQIHLVATDAHSPRHRVPRMSGAYARIVEWCDVTVADRLCSTNGLAILQGRPIATTRPKPHRPAWRSLLGF